MCVVNKNGRMVSNTGTSIEPIMVNNNIIPIVATIGPIEFSEKQDNVKANVATVTNDKKAIAKP